MSQQTKKGHFPWKHIIGFLISIALTLVAFATALWTDWSSTTIFIIILIFAVIQAALQLLMFMHMTEGEDGGLISGNTLFGFFIAIVIIVGTYWLMTSGHMHMGMSM